MKRSSHVIWLALVLVTLAGLIARERLYPLTAPPLLPASALATAAAPEQPFSTTALALAFGFQPERQRSSRADITLKACFVSSQGGARALVKSAGGEAVYRVGERIAGHDVLRRIDVRSIVLWVDGREEVVALATPGPSVFLPMGAAPRPRPVSDPSSRLLREVQ